MRPDEINIVKTPIKTGIEDAAITTSIGFVTYHVCLPSGIIITDPNQFGNEGKKNHYL